MAERATAVAEPHGKHTIRHYGNRFGRSEEARTAVMEAVDDLLLERGFAALTIEAVAARASVGKQTIYRWWSSKTDLLFDAYLDETREELEPIDLGSFRADLKAHLRQIITFFGKAGNVAMFRALVGQAQHDEAAARRFYSEIVEQQLERDRCIFENARARGDLPTGMDVEEVIEELMAPLFHRLLVTNRPYDAHDADRAVERLLAHCENPLR